MNFTHADAEVLIRDGAAKVAALVRYDFEDEHGVRRRLVEVVLLDANGDYVRSLMQTPRALFMVERMRRAPANTGALVELEARFADGVAPAHLLLGYDGRLSAGKSAETSRNPIAAT